MFLKLQPKLLILQIKLLLSLAATASQESNTMLNYQDSWGIEGYTLESASTRSVVINFSIRQFSLSEVIIDGEPMVQLELPGHFLGNDEGAPNLPGSGRYIAVPKGSEASLKVISTRTDLLTHVQMAPAPRIHWETETGPLEYSKNIEIYSRDAFYPEQNITLSDPDKIRGLDVVMLGITPFQYNPVTQELIIFRDIKIEISFTGGGTLFGDNRLRSRWWDPLYSDILLNYTSLPEMNYNKSFQATDEVGCEYLIISPTGPEFLQWADSIKWFRTLQGIKTMVVTVDEAGGNNATAIENFINTAYNSWDIVPVAILLLGDYGTNGNSSVISPMYNNYCVSDNMLGDINGNHLPDIIMARITANNANQLQAMVSKFIGYELMPPTDPGFYSHPMTCLGYQTERWFQVCTESIAGYWENVLGKTTTRVNAIYSGNPATGPWSTAPNTTMVVNFFGPNGLNYIPSSPGQVNCTWNGTGNAVVAGINNGTFMVVHRDHGAETLWGEPDFSNAHVSSLINTDLTYVWSVNCLTGKYNYSGECLVEKLHRHTAGGLNAGVLGAIGDSEVSYSFVNDTYLWGAIDNMWPDFMPGYGSTPAERGIMPAFANAAGKYFLEASNWPYNTNNKEVTYHLFHHHGDAFLSVYSEIPQLLTVSHNPVLLAGANSFEVIADEGSLIALTVNGEIIGTATGTGAPTVIMIPGQEPPDQLVVTVTKQNYFRYSSLVEVIPPMGPYVIDDSFVINDISGGNGNGMMDYGESNLLSIQMKNIGVLLADNVVVNLSTQDSYITLTDTTEAYGTIPAGATMMIPDGFAYHVSSQIPDGHWVPFQVAATDGTDTWISNFMIPAHAPVLEFTGFVITDPAGNNNGKMDPGETVDLMVSLINSGSSGATDVLGFLSETNPYVTINNGTAAVGNVSAGNTAVAWFSVTADETTPPGNPVTFYFEMTANPGITGSGEFEVIIGQIPILILNFDGNNNSAPVMEQALADMDLTYEILTGWPPGLEIYSTIFVCLGVYPNNHILTTSEGQLLANYLTQGGKLYMEGGDTWYYDPETPVHPMFHIIAVSDGASDMGTILGQAGTFTEGMTFQYSGDNSWMDHINPSNPAFSILTNQSPAYGTGVAYDAGIYRTIGTSHEFGGLSDGTPPSTKTDLMTAYLDFFGIHIPLQAMFSANATEVCPGETVPFYDQSAGIITSWSWTFEGGSPATSGLQNPTVMYANPGAFDVSLEISDGNESSAIILPDYITVFDQPEQAGAPAGETEICTNWISFSEYTTSGSNWATSYVWEVSPPDAGSVTGNGTTGTITWNGDWEGEAYVRVKGMNACGEGDFSEPLMIQCAICTGIEENQGMDQIEIFPNPNDGRFTILFGAGIGLIEIKVLNTMNEKIYSDQLNAGTDIRHPVNLQNLPAGVYLVQFISGDSEAIRKIIIH